MEFKIGKYYRTQNGLKLKFVFRRWHRTFPLLFILREEFGEKALWYPESGANAQQHPVPGYKIIGEWNTTEAKL